MQQAVCPQVKGKAVLGGVEKYYPVDYEIKSLKTKSCKKKKKSHKWLTSNLKYKTIISHLKSLFRNTEQTETNQKTYINKSKRNIGNTFSKPLRFFIKTYKTKRIDGSNSCSHREDISATQMHLHFQCVPPLNSDRPFDIDQQEDNLYGSKELSEI